MILNPDKPVKLSNLFLFYLLHIGLAFAMRSSQYIGLAQALLVTLLGFNYITHQPFKTVMAAGYIVASEALWRMTKVPILWEYAKYAISAFGLILCLTKGTKRALLPTVYFFLQIPAVLLLFDLDMSFKAFRSEVSFNLSGPFSLMMCILLFSKIRFRRADIHRLFLVMTGPIVGILAITASGTYKSDVVFGTESNFAASGGFGPNQVSAALGLGALVAIFYVLDSQAKKSIKILLTAVALALLGQAMMTFSRGGLFNSLLSIAASSLFLIQNPRLRNRLIMMGVVFFLLGNFVILPKLDRFTGGALKARFQDKTLTGREEIMQDDINIWKSHFLLGVGPGQARYHRELFRPVPAHSEFTRMLSEHGVLGLCSLFLLLTMAGGFFLKAKSNRDRAFVVAMVSWACLFMGANAMRIVAPSFMFGLAAVTFWPENSISPPQFLESRLNRNDPRKQA